jgi:hypothetical protein
MRKQNVTSYNNRPFLHRTGETVGARLLMEIFLRIKYTYFHAQQNCHSKITLVASDTEYYCTWGAVDEYKRKIPCKMSDKTHSFQEKENPSILRFNNS